ncbi:putative membrane protein [Escherichia coli TA008]|nr:integrating conjugative element membrane protein, PFL_4697 family [Escherichia coli 113290]OSL65602.1 putative membrane protein [Escherichia coli TA008]
MKEADMAEARRDAERSPQSRAPRQHGLLYNLVWGWPWALVGLILSSLLLSLLIEYAGMTFFWSEEGAAHSRAVMNTELGWLSTEFTRSLLLSAPAETVPAWISAAYQWLFVDSGMQTWLHAQQAGTAAGRSVSEFSSELSQWLAYHLHDYLLATVYVTVVTMVRVVILVLSVPLFVMVVLVAVVEGLGRRDLRRYGAAYESSFVYHHAKKSVRPAIYVPCIIYLSWPGAVYPNLLIWPAAMLLGLAVTVTVASFKKYL